MPPNSEHLRRIASEFRWLAEDLRPVWDPSGSEFADPIAFWRAAPILLDALEAGAFSDPKYASLRYTVPGEGGRDHASAWVLADDILFDLEAKDRLSEAVKHALSGAKTEHPAQRVPSVCRAFAVIAEEEADAIESAAGSAEAGSESFERPGPDAAEEEDRPPSVNSAPTPPTEATQPPRSSATRRGAKAPPERHLIAYRLSVVWNVTQAELAERLSQELGEPVDQPKVARWLKRVKQWIEAGNVMPDLTTYGSVAEQDPDPVASSTGPGGGKTRRNAQRRKAADRAEANDD